MPVKIRLTRVGKKKQPSYRVVVMDSRKPRDGRYIEQIGRYDPRQEPSLIEINNERALDWLHKGAQPTDRARKLLEITGAWAQFRVDKGEIHTVGEHAPTAYPEKAEEAVEEVASDQLPAPSSEEEAVEEVASDQLPVPSSGEEATEEVASDPVGDSEEEAAEQAENAVEAISEGSPKEAEDTAETSAENAADVAEEENSEDA